jgi:NarL family two-component system response regulator LiaR
MVRRGLMAMLATYADMEVVGEARGGEQAAALAVRLNPDVVLMDLVMPGMDGVEATRRLRASRPDAQVIALTSFKERELVEGVIKAGAIGYLLKDISGDELAAAIRAAAARRPTLAPEAAQALMQAARQPEAADYDLTRSEREVLGWIVKGLSKKEIALRLVVCESTVKYHASNILSKLGVSSRAEVISRALRENLA